MTDWCILRCAGARTLRLVASLNGEGIEAWTPTETQVRRPRQGGEKTERIVAVIPSFGFARARHLHELAGLAESMSSPHPHFSLFRHCGRFPLVSDREVFRLRQIERRAAAKAIPPVFTQGQDIRVPDGPFEGLTGRVIETTDGKWVMLAFPGFPLPISFASWTLSVAA